MKVPDDEADDEEWQIDDDVVHDFVEKLKPKPTSYTASQLNSYYYNLRFLCFCFTGQNLLHHHWICINGAKIHHQEHESVPADVR